jgi:hypothetical protein
VGRIVNAPLLAILAACISGIIGSWLYLKDFHNGNANMGGDFEAAIAVSLLGTPLLALTFYWPIMKALQKRGAAWWAYLVTGVVAFPVPWLIVGGLWGGLRVLSSLASPEAFFVYSIFAPAGATFAAVYCWFTRRAERRDT